MSALPSPRLQGSGQAIMSGSAGEHSARGQGNSIKDMSIAEMENALERYSKRMPDRPGGTAAPQTARLLLEENKQLIVEKQERKALERKSSREFTETLLAKDRVTNENDKARDMGRRHAQRELAAYYKSKIAEKEAARAEEYRKKVQSGSELQYFPFVEGENINKSREEQKGKMKDEMQSFLRKQLEEHPPRQDQLLADVSNTHAISYPPLSARQPRGSSVPPPGSRNVTDSGAAPFATSDDVAPYMQRYPRFLSRAREHMSRRLHDQHVRSALEQKVLQTKEELEGLAKRRLAEVQQAEDGMLVNDALRYDSTQTKAIERRRNADFLMNQVKEKQQKLESEKQETKSQPHGYWGPDEKTMQGEDVLRANCATLIKQMEVNQHRRLESRSRRLRQERRIVDNCMAEMSQDREADRLKAQQHREVLVTTWNSQKKIKEAMTRIAAI